MEKTRGFEIVSTYQDKEINLPIRKTKNSVGYDFEAAEDVIIPSMWRSMLGNVGKFFTGVGEFDKIKPTLIKTGIKSYFQPDEGLFLANRSSNPFKKGLVLANSLGVVESDYYNNSDNEGELMFAFYNFFPVDIEIKKGEPIGQGFFLKYLKSDNDNAEGERLGGFGSTDSNK